MMMSTISTQSFVPCRKAGSNLVKLGGLGFVGVQMALRCTTIRSPIGISGRGFVVALVLCDLLLPINGLYKGLYHERPVQFMFVFDMTI